MTTTNTIRRRTVAAVVAGAAATSTFALAAPAEAAKHHRAWATWDRVAACESGGRWHVSTGNGYYGGLQFSSSTWRAYGGHKYAAQANRASRVEQIAVARRVLAAAGPGSWPVCGPRAGLTRHSGAATHKALPAVASEPGYQARHRAPAVHRPTRPTTHTAAHQGKHHYRVHSGDTLSGIARTHHVAGGYRTLAKLNHLHNPNVLHVGQVLTLP